MNDEKQPQVLRLLGAFSRRARESAPSLRMTERMFDEIQIERGSSC
jgi:hypothetical protein